MTQEPDLSSGTGQHRLALTEPVHLARWQLARDDERVARHVDLRAHKIRRMQASPLAFLRGAAPLYYQLLSDNPGLAQGPSGEGWIVGDLHVQNFGVYRPGTFAAEETTPRGVFDVNDFDDAVTGPWRLDLLRLLTSLLLGWRAQAASLEQLIELGRMLIGSYVDVVFAARPLPDMPPAVARLLEKVEGRTRQDLLDARTVVAGGERRFARRPDRYRDIDGTLAAKARAAFDRFVDRLPVEERPNLDAFSILDLAFRVAGTGSLGNLRIAVLVRGKGGRNGAWIFDMKEEAAPSASVLLGGSLLDPGARVITSLRTCVDPPPRMIGTTELDGMAMLVRRLAPQEDRINLDQVPAEERAELARYLGALTGRIHRRGAVEVPDRRWTRDGTDHLLEVGLLLAGVHEAAHRAYVRLTQAAQPQASSGESA